MPLFQTGATYKNQSELARRDRLLGEGLDDLASQSAVLRKYAFVGLTGPPAPPTTPAKLQVSVNSSGVFSATVVHNSPELGTQYVLQYSTTPNFQLATTTSELLTHTPSIPTTWQKNLPAGTGLYFRTAAKFPASKLGPWVYAGGSAGPSLFSAAKASSVQQVLSSGGGGGGGGSSLALEVNGTPNADQNLLNLFNGPGISIMDAGAGKVVVAASGFTTAGQGFFYGPGFTSPLQLISDIVTEIAPSDVANRVYGVTFLLRETWTLRKCAWLGFNQAVGAGFGFGIYDLSTLNALVTTYFDSPTVLNTPTLNLLTPATIGPGVFSFNWATSNSALIGPTMLIAPPSGGQEPYMFAFYNLGTVGGMVYAANAMAANVMPANLGSLTNCVGTEAPCIPMCKWTP